jgi:thiamine biosynthesis lipoprotein
MKNICIIAAGLLLSLAACVSRKQQEVKIWGEAQGSTYSIIYIDPELRNFQDSVQQILEDIDLSMSTWRAESRISALNNGDTIIPDAYFLAVLNKSFEVHQIAEGYFDVTVAPIVNAWGMGSSSGESISSAYLDSLRNYIGMDKIKQSETIYLSNPNSKIDFNAIAQGYTVDVVAEFLMRQGIYDFMVEIGGEIRTMGRNKNDKEWRIGIDKPVSNASGRPLQVILKLENQALATSGSYRKFKIKDGIRYSHAINPKTGRPVDHSLLSVSVIAADCMTADAFATAFLVMGVDKSLALLESLDLEAYFISDDGKGSFDVQMTKGFYKFILEDVFE